MLTLDLNIALSLIIFLLHLAWIFSPAADENHMIFRAALTPILTTGLLSYLIHLHTGPLPWPYHVLLGISILCLVLGALFILYMLAMARGMRN